MADQKSVKNKNFEQVRQNVQKDFWQNDNKSSIHYQVLAKNSILQINQEKQKLSIKEKMQTVASTLCNNDEITTFQTSEATFHFPTKQLQTSQCNIYHSSPFREDCFAKADQSIFTFINKTPQITLQNNVQIFSKQKDGKETFGLSDSLIYNLKEKQIQLQSNASNKVLFKQNDLRLSSKEVLIFKDPITSTQTVKGTGNVRFTFNLEEQNLFHEIFGK